MNEQAGNSLNAGVRLARFILFGNYFLAFCIVALSYETTLKTNAPITGYQYYIVTFFAVIIYYTYAYMHDEGMHPHSNSRTQWYFVNQKLIVFTQVAYAVLVISFSMYLLNRYMSSFRFLTSADWCLLLVFPVTALLYYGIIFPDAYKVQLRSVAWLKPFIIGFVCTGCIVIYPMLYASLQHQEALHITVADGCYFITNWLFTTAIAIMFDIKDFAADHNYQLKTFVVAKGLRYTIFFILLPLSGASFISFIVFAALKHYSIYRIAVNVTPFILLLYVATTLRHRRGILYYLIIIDGLLLIKALFGIVAISFIN